MKNRSLWQILAFYAAASWVVLQVGDATVRLGETSTKG